MIFGRLFSVRDIQGDRYKQGPVSRKPRKLSGPGARFSKVPKSFRTPKAITKISNLKFTELFFSHIFKHE